MSDEKKSRKGAPGRVTATHAAKHMGQLVDRVREERAVYVIERSGTAVAQIGPVDRAPFTIGDFKALVRSAPPAGEEYLAAVERAAGARNKPRRRTNPWER